MALMASVMVICMPFLGDLCASVANVVVALANRTRDCTAPVAQLIGAGFARWAVRAFA